jgi:hypothetical protein
MNNALTLDLVSIEELSTVDMNAIFGGTTDPIVVDNGNTGIITAVWFDTGIRP